MVENSFLLFIPARGEFLKIQPGTGDNLSSEDISAGFTDYILWNRFVLGPLIIDGELEMECVDSGILLIKEIPGQARDDKNALIASASPRNDAQGVRNDILKDVLEQAYNDRSIEVVLLIQS